MLPTLPAVEMVTGMVAVLLLPIATEPKFWAELAMVEQRRMQTERSKKGIRDVFIGGTPRGLQVFCAGSALLRINAVSDGRLRRAFRAELTGPTVTLPTSPSIYACFRLMLSDSGYDGMFIFGEGCLQLRLWEVFDVLFAFAAEVDHSFAGEECPVADGACRG
jgi:hypothetical protein